MSEDRMSDDSEKFLKQQGIILLNDGFMHTEKFPKAHAYNNSMCQVSFKSEIINYDDLLRINVCCRCNDHSIEIFVNNLGEDYIIMSFSSSDEATQVYNIIIEDMVKYKRRNKYSKIEELLERFVENVSFSVGLEEYVNSKSDFEKNVK